MVIPCGSEVQFKCMLEDNYNMSDLDDYSFCASLIETLV